MIISDFAEFKRVNGGKIFVNMNYISAIEVVQMEYNDDATAIHINNKAFWIEEPYELVKKELEMRTAKCLVSDEEDDLK